MHPVPWRAEGLALPILKEGQEIPNEAEVIIIPPDKCLSHADAFPESEQIAPEGLLDFRTVVAMDVAGQPLLLDTMGARPAVDD